MRLTPGLGLLAVLTVLLAAFAYGRSGSTVEAAPSSINVYDGVCSGVVGIPTPLTEISPGQPVCAEFNFSAVTTADVFDVAVTGASGGGLTHFSCSFPGWCGAGPSTVVGPYSLQYTAASDPLFNFGTILADLTLTDCTQPITLSATDGTTLDEEIDCVTTGPAPTVSITAVYSGTCAGLTVPLPAHVTAVEPGDDYCISSFTSDDVIGDTMTFSLTGVTGETFDLNVCFTDSVGFDPCTPHPTPGASPYVITTTGNDPTFGIGLETDFSLTACDTDTLTLTFSYDGPGLEPASDMETLDCVDVGPAPTVNIIAVYETTCAALPFPLPTPVTAVEPGVDYCITSVASDHVAGDTMTYTSDGVGGASFDLEICYTNSAGFDPCTDPGAGGTPYVIPLASEDSNSFVGLDTDFSIASCDTDTLTLTFSYDGPALEPASDMETLDCNDVGPAPTVDISAVYESTCAGLTLPLPTPVSSVEPGVAYCIASGATDHVMGDTMTFTSAGVGGASFDLSVCYTNSAGFDPCTDPGAGGTPYVIPLESEDSNSFVGLETDFSVASCDMDTLTLTFSYDGPALESASDIETLGCADAPTTPVGEFRKYTDGYDNVVSRNEVFKWYIEVPATDGEWTVKDKLPRGFSLLSIHGDANCWETYGESFVCEGSDNSSPIVLTIRVKAPRTCGDYTNTAWLKTDTSHIYASDTVEVEDCRSSNPRGRGGRG